MNAARTVTGPRCVASRVNGRVPSVETILADLNAYPAPHPGAGIERVGDRLMAASSDDQLHTFVEDDEEPSYTAERIVELADGTRTVGEIAAAIASEFEGAPIEQIQADVQQFVGDLVARYVLVLHNHPVST